MGALDSVFLSPAQPPQHKLASRFDRQFRHFDQLVAQRFVHRAYGVVERFGFCEALGAFGVVDVDFGPRREDEDRALVAASAMSVEPAFRDAVAALVQVAEDVGEGAVEEAAFACLRGVVVLEEHLREGEVGEGFEVVPGRHAAGTTRFAPDQLARDLPVAAAAARFERFDERTLAASRPAGDDVASRRFRFGRDHRYFSTGNQLAMLSRSPQYRCR